MSDPLASIRALIAQWEEKLPRETSTRYPLLNRCIHELSAALAAVPPSRDVYLLEVIASVRDVLATMQKQMGAVPGQDGYSTRMSEPEKRLADTVADLDRILRESAVLASVPPPQEEEKL
jgi:hypothetical protein